MKGLMDDVTAGFLKEQLNRFEERRWKRLDLLGEYQNHLRRFLMTPPDGSSGHLCVVRAPSYTVRQLWRRALNTGQIANGHHYPLTKQQYKSCPNAADLSSRILTLPLHVGMDKASVRRVCMRLLSA